MWPICPLTSSVCMQQTVSHCHCAIINNITALCSLILKEVLISVVFMNETGLSPLIPIHRDSRFQSKKNSTLAVSATPLGQISSQISQRIQIFFSQMDLTI